MIFNFRFRFKDEGSMPYNWETLNPMNLVQKMKTMYGNIKGNKGNNFEFKAFEDFMKRVSLNQVSPFTYLHQNVKKHG